MKLELRNKLMLLLASPDNPLWRDLLGRDVEGPNEVKRLSAISSQNIRSWIVGGEVQKHDIVFRAIKESIIAGTSGQRCKLLTKKIRDYEDIFISNTEKSVTKAAYLLGYNYSAYQRALDSYLYRSNPLLAMAYYRDLHSAEDALSQTKGLYVVEIERGAQKFKCTMRVRYVLSINKDSHYIRCKLHVPHDKDGSWPNKGKDRYEYDGFLSVIDDSNYWMFEKRSSSNRDMIFFITGRIRNLSFIGRSSESQFIAEGMYLTKGQDENRSLVSGYLGIVRHSCNDQQINDKDYITDFMSNNCKIQ